MSEQATATVGRPLGVVIEPYGLKNIVLRSHGRFPWYTQDGQLISPAFVIGVAGGSASGKTHVAREIVKALGHIPSVVIMSQDSFYKALTTEQSKKAFDNNYDFDHPSAIDVPLFAKCLDDLKQGRQTNIPVYSFSLHQRLSETQYLYGASIVIAEGILALSDPELRTLYDLKIFVQCDSDLMLARRIQRDVNERGRSVEGVLQQYLRFVKPSYDNFVLPSSKYADVIVPGQNNHVAIDLITTHIRKKLDERSVKFRETMAKAQMNLWKQRMTPGTENPPEITAPDAGKDVHVLPQSPQLKGIYTMLRDFKTSKSDFIFYADRLSTLVIEKAMEFLPFREKIVRTPVEVDAMGKELALKSGAIHDLHQGTGELCGVSIETSGGPLRKGLERVVRDCLLGTILIQRDAKSGDPLLLYSSIPSCIRLRPRAEKTWVFLLDTQIVTGSAAMMAIRILLDHGVPASQIIFCTFLVAADGGVHQIQRAFPGVKIVTGAVDGRVVEAWIDEDVIQVGSNPRQSATRRKVWNLEPGMGHIGERYY
ncbi:uncharacterized protein EI90DRAFT_3143886 [Cantharellus anzutake]|uniref:uncharacterized protein n=1 Tax=Cantharellus anzutake TaxID=1750568 RepID=UPI0019053E1C|nr:uncharacterized protein EI90DRAFT_3143886 [Cantharellus anzutake]KAF8340521.1 hypothetical protein EI90DRAFT_3143886 [Cantharellus anzutake]